MRRFLILVLLASCAPPAPTPPRPVSYSADVRPFFIAKCNPCHFPGSPVRVNLVDPFDPVEGLINLNTDWSGRWTTRVIPGNPDESWLMKKIDGTVLDEKTEGFQMPKVLPRVTPAELADMRQWITDGANDDAFYRSNVAPVFGNAANLGRSIGKCSYCHTAISLYSPDVVNAFGPRGLVNVNSGFGGKRVVPGDPDASVLLQKLADVVPASLGAAMPPNYEPATEAEVDAVRRWIAEGAKND